MSTTWKDDGHLPAVYAEPLCVHELCRARAKLAGDLLALIEQDCTEGLSLTLRRGLAHAGGRGGRAVDALWAQRLGPGGS